MKLLATLCPVAFLLVAACATSTNTTVPPSASTDHDIAPAPSLEQHAWLEQFLGEWTVNSEASMGPDTEPMLMESTESVRSVGGLWIVAEGRSTFNGTPFSSVMTLGYDPAQRTFVGTWIDTMQTHLWTYVGTLDASRKTLTLAADGPSFGDPNKTAKYRDAITFVAPDHRVLNSSVQGDDGTWTTYLRAEYRRKK